MLVTKTRKKRDTKLIERLEVSDVYIELYSKYY